MPSIIKPVVTPPVVKAPVTTPPVVRPPVIRPPVVFSPVIAALPPFGGPIFVPVPSGGDTTIVESGSSPIVLPAETTVIYQYERFLTVKNATQEQARISIRLADRNGNWLTGEGTGDKALVVELEAGQSYWYARQYWEISSHRGPVGILDIPVYRRPRRSK